MNCIDTFQLRSKICALLDNYDHKNSSGGVDTIIKEWQKNKANLMEMLGRHPNYDAENHRIVFSTDYTRGFDKSAIKPFVTWMTSNYRSMARKTVAEAIIIDGLDIDEAENEYTKLSEITNAMRKIRSVAKESVLIADGMTYEELNERKSNIAAEFAKYVKLPFGGWITIEQDKMEKQLGKFGELLLSIETNEVTDEFAETFKAIYPDIHCAKGTRINKIVSRVCKKYGLDKIVEMKQRNFTAANGETITRLEDVGYNKQIAVLGDAINPLKITRHTVISVNPLDYLTMSFGNSWASCHTIDKENTRHCRNHYEGQYCSGTLSYMLDQTSIVFYTIDRSFNGNDYETQDKINRCMFHISENGEVMVQGRVYPDARDGGDGSLASQFRAIMQHVLAQCNGNNNMWILKRGISEIRSHVKSQGTHYEDFFHYGDCTVSFLKGVQHEYSKVKIGHAPICPNCGCEHERADWLCCEDCQGGGDEYCAYCGRGINTDVDDYEYCEDNGEYYCDHDCAVSDDLYYCENDGRYHTSNNCYRDDWDDEYYAGDPVIETEDGNFYSCSENADRAGYIYVDGGKWWSEDEVACDEHTGEYFHIDTDTVEIDGNYFSCEENAIAYGYAQNENGDWIMAEEEAA